MKQMLEQVMKTLGQGLLLGIGAAFGFGGLYWLLMPQLRAGMEARMDEVMSELNPSRDDIELSEAKELATGQHWRYVGRATNRGRFKIEEIVVDVDLHHRGAFVDKCRERYDVAIGPGESRYFELRCGGPEWPVAEHDAYAIAVIDVIEAH